MRYMYMFGIVVASYYFIKYINKNQKLHLLFSESKLTQIFQLMSLKHFENMPKAYLLPGHFQTVMLEITNILYKLIRNILRIYSHTYTRELFKLSDGAKIAVDHAISTNFENSKTENETYRIISRRENKTADKILLIVPGITSNSEDLYIRHFVEDFFNDFQCKVINSRGLGGVKLYNEKLICSDLFEDLWEYLQKLCKENPDSQVFACGFSYGGHILTRVLTTYSDVLPKNLIAAAGVCYPITVKEIELSLNNFYGLYTIAMIKGIKRIFFNNIESIFDPKTCRKEILEQKEYLIETMKTINSIEMYSKNYVHKILGYKSIEEYYDKGDLRKGIKNISIPFLSWFTEDDPIIPINIIPFDSFQKNSNTVTIISEHGGHLGLFSGGFMPKRFISEPIKNFFKLIYILNDNKNQ